MEKADFNLRQDDIIGIIGIMVIFDILGYFYKNMGVFLDTRSVLVPGRSWQGPFFSKRTRPLSKKTRILLFLCILFFKSETFCVKNVYILHTSS